MNIVYPDFKRWAQVTSNQAEALEQAFEQGRALGRREAREFVDEIKDDFQHQNVLIKEYELELALLLKRIDEMLHED